MHGNLRLVRIKRPDLDRYAAATYLHALMKRVIAVELGVGKRVAWSIPLLLLMFVLGCETTETAPSDMGVAGTADTGRHWMPVPTSVRVYPSTRFIKESGRAILEARFELYDEMGDPVKYAGAFQIELFSVDESLGNTPRRLLYTWNAELSSLEQQREHYDPITRGYLFRLGVDNLKIARQVTLLKVVFAPIDRARLEAEAEVRSDW
jgi:hypothetical protein